MPHKLEQRNIKATEIRVVTGADGSKVLTGYAVRFNSPSVDLGGWTEICSPGMFSRTLKQSPDVLMLRDHLSSQLLGRTTAGTLTLNQDDKGLAFSVTLPNTAIADDTVENIRLGNLDACSFGFNVPEGGDKWTSTSDGAVVRTLLDVNLAEVSITSFAAYPETSVSLRSLPPSMRGLITRANSNGCDCDCAECLDGDCESCSMLDCEDAECAEHGCPNQDDDERSKPLNLSERHKLHMRLEISKRK
jgi:uncharacterized protein